MNYSGDQGQTIRQLLSAHMIRRVAMCCLSSPHGKRQHLGTIVLKLYLKIAIRMDNSYQKKLGLHIKEHMESVFTYIYPLLNEKDICDCRNISIKLLCVCVCLSPGDLLIFFW